MAVQTAEATTAPSHDVAHDADHGHSPHLKHYFVSSEQQFDAAKMGMWLFLITEILLFSAFFVAYTVYRVWHPEVFAIASDVALDWRMGTVNTLVLLGSSFTVAMGIRCAQTDNQKGLVRNLWLTVALAGVFMVIKYFEYTAKFSHGIFPGENFAPHGSYAVLDLPYAAQFFSIYFVMTGVHGLHVVIGMITISIVAWRAMKGAYSSEYYTPVELSGLYWHLVDIIWIFVFPLLYLV